MVRSHFACGSRGNRIEGFDTGHMGDVDLRLPPIGSEPAERAGLRGLRSRRRMVLEATDLHVRKLTGILRVDDDELPCHGRSAEASLEFFRSDLGRPGRLRQVRLERGCSRSRVTASSDFGAAYST